MKLLYKSNSETSSISVTEATVKRVKMNNPRILLLALLFAVAAQINGLYTISL